MDNSCDAAQYAAFIALCCIVWGAGYVCNKLRRRRSTRPRGALAYLFGNPRGDRLEFGDLCFQLGDPFLRFNLPNVALQVFLSQV